MRRIMARQLCLLGIGWALLAVASYFFRVASSAGSLRRNSSEAVMSYQPPSAKSTRALPLKLTVITRPTRPLKRASSGRDSLASTSWSVHSCLSCSNRGSAVSIGGLWLTGLVGRIGLIGPMFFLSAERSAVAARGWLEVEAL